MNTEQTFITTATGKTAHIGTASKGQVQTLCGIGYGRRARGRALAAELVKPEQICKRCAAMSDDSEADTASEERFAEPVAVRLGDSPYALTTWAWTPAELAEAEGWVAADDDDNGYPADDPEEETTFEQAPL